jgi:hypothetical protein
MLPQAKSGLCVSPIITKRHVECAPQHGGIIEQIDKQR